MKKLPCEIRDELLLIYLHLEENFTNHPHIEDGDVKLTYLNIQLCEALLNAIRATEYHFREEIPELRSLKKYDEALERAQKALKKYGEPSDESNPHSKIVLKKKYDDTGYLLERDWFADVLDNRQKLKRKR
jgi:hypothetical protein